MAIYRGAGGASDSVDDATVNAVAAYAASAASSAIDAAASAVEADAAASSTSGSVAAVATSASNAATSASNASISASNASVSASSADASATSATASALAASVSAFESAASALGADTSEANAAASAASSSTFADNSAASAASALAIYGNTTAMNNAVSAAATSASNAATSASNAATSAITATTQAANASDSAIAADSSELSALIYANNASISASNAATSAANAATSATASATSATNSASVYGGLSAVNTAVATTTTNANNAATSASNAATSATQAAASAASASAIVLGTASSLPSIRPTLNLDFANSDVIDPRITFTRASTATYYDGKTTAKAEENLLLQSQLFSSGNWNLLNATRTDGITDPTGGVTASTITKTANENWMLRQNPSVNTQNATLTFSLFLKGTGTVTLRSDNFINQALTQQLTLSSTWTRYTWTFTFNATGSTTICAVGIGITASDTATSFDVAFTQLEQRSSVTAYTPTTTQAITNYIPVLQTAASGVARLDHDPITFAAKGLLIEEARTNLTTQSQTFSSWAGGAITATTAAQIAPDGTLTSTRVVPTAVNATHVIYFPTAQGSGTFTFSVYAKASGYPRLGIRVYDGTAYQIYTTFDISAGTIVSAIAGTAAITSVGNGWYRCTCTGTSASGNMGTLSGWAVESLPGTATVQNSFTGDGTSGAYIWGAQVEAGAFATSYIPTTTAQATRAADNAVITTLTPWYNQTEGALFVEAISSAGAATLTFSDNTTNNFILLGANSFVGGLPRTFAVRKLNINQVLMNVVTISSVDLYKSAAAYKLDDFVNSVNGAAVVADTSGVVPSVTQLQIGGVLSSSGQQYIRTIIYYPKRLSNTELQALTA